MDSRRPVPPARVQESIPGRTFPGDPLLGYDNAEKTIEIMIDNRSTSVLQNEGSISQDGKVISNIGESYDRHGKALHYAPSRPSWTPATSPWSGSGSRTGARRIEL